MNSLVEEEIRRVYERATIARDAEWRKQFAEAPIPLGLALAMEEQQAASLSLAVEEIKESIKSLDWLNLNLQMLKNYLERSLEEKQRAGIAGLEGADE